jgi:cytoskeletal protein RodZ
MASLGQELRRERELRGISLREISDTTRINLRFLQALEEDRLDVIPGAFFVRAILRAYARGIGIDEDQVLNKYQETHTFEEQLQYGESLASPPPRRKPISRLFVRKIVWIPALAVAAAGVGLFLFLTYFRPPEKAQPAAEKSAPTATAQIEVPKRNPPLEPQPLIEEADRLRLSMLFTEETWIRVTADGKPVWDGIKNGGDTLDVGAEQEVLLSIGNAAGLNLTINGRKAKPLGPSGAVRTDIRITPDNYLDYLVPEQETTG